MSDLENIEPEGCDDLAKLEALARAATPGPWGTLRQGNTYWAVIIRCDTPLLNDANECDAAYIATANPAAILALIERVRVAEEAVMGGWKVLRRGYEK